MPQEILQRYVSFLHQRLAANFNATIQLFLR
jgi:hypothetical protein